MPNQPDYYFLPSGAFKSPVEAVRFLPSSLQPSILHQPQPPMSPPKTRSTSADDSSAGLVENWRAYVHELRGQFQGERAHLRADRDRINEVIDAERELWERERNLWNIELRALKARILELEAKLLEAQGSAADLPGPSNTHPGSRSVSLDSGVSKIPQESGRDADGTPFYAPAPVNPTRSFDPEAASELRVDDLAAHRETPIRVTSKELTSSDFVPQAGRASGAVQAPVVPEAIDISHIQPELDGVAIRVTAVSPSFAARVLVLSPQNTSPKSSPTNEQSHQGTSEQGQSSLHVSSHPENRRLTMFAGHTPNHSLSKFVLMDGEVLFEGSETDTPSQTNYEISEEDRVTIFKNNDQEIRGFWRSYEQDEITEDKSDDGDKQLIGSLGLTNESGSDNYFLSQLNEKLAEEARKYELSSPNRDSKSEQQGSAKSKEKCDDCDQASDSPEVEEEGPPLRMKPSLNFGCPFGKM